MPPVGSTNPERREGETMTNVEIGSSWTVREGWNDMSLGWRDLRVGEIVTVSGFDSEGDPLFGSASGEGSLYRADFLRRVDFLEPAPAVAPAPSPIVVGQRRAERPPTGGVYTVEEINLDRGEARLSFLDHPGADGSWFSFAEILEDPIVDESAVDPDRKPRGVKPPMALIPWDVVPAAWVPEAVDLALGLPERTGPESFAARVIRILLEISSDELLPEVARVMGHGAAKYGVDNWKTATWNADARREYESAMLRHLYADAIGEALDPDSGLRHKAHAVASAMILEWHDRRVAGADGGAK
jgi:hypothetical protein